MLLDDRGKVVWSLDLPPEIPLSYTHKGDRWLHPILLKGLSGLLLGASRWSRGDGVSKGAYMRYTLDFAESDVEPSFNTSCYL